MMPDQPHLQLRDPPPGLARRPSSPRGFWLLGLLQILTLVAVGLLLKDRVPLGRGPQSDAGRVEAIRATAISLEDRSLAAEAASAWREVLRLAPAADDRPQVLYRIGKLLIDAEDFGGAVAALVEVEQLTAAGDQLDAKVGPKIVECLRRLGRYGEVGRELSRQVEIGSSQRAESGVLATFAGETFTAADLDRELERTVDRVLALQADGQFSIRREQLLAQYESHEARQRLLQEIIQRELFSRRARELKIDQEDSFRQTRELVDTELLASQFLARELARIQPTDVDLESFYAANQADYHQPETATIRLLPLPEDQAVEDALAEIETAEAFRQRAAENGEGKDVAPLRIVSGQPHVRLGDTTALFALDEGEWTKRPVTTADEKLLVLVESKTPPTTPSLSQIRFRVEADYRRRKQQELMQQLSQELMSRYDVKLVAQQPAESAPGSTAGAGSQAAAAAEDDQ